MSFHFSGICAPYNGFYPLCYPGVGGGDLYSAISWAVFGNLQYRKVVTLMVDIYKVNRKMAL